MAKSMDKDWFEASSLTKQSLGTLRLEEASPLPKTHLPNLEVKYTPANVDPLTGGRSIDTVNVVSSYEPLSSGPVRTGRPIDVFNGSLFESSAYKSVPARKLLPQEVRSLQLAKYPFLADKYLSVQNLRDAGDLR